MTELLSKVFDFLFYLLHSFGPLGLFAYCFVALLIYMPIGPDIFIIAHSISCKCLPILDILAALSAYALACTINFWIGRMLGYRVRGKIMAKMENLSGRYGRWAMFIAGLTPIPLREASIAAGILKMKYRDFFFPLLFALAIRFSFEGSLGLWI